MRRKIIHGPFTDPKKISGGADFISRHGVGLRWLAGLWHSWPQLSETQRQRWRFYVLGPESSSTLALPPMEHWQALLVHQPSLGWWALCCAVPLPEPLRAPFPQLLQSLGPLALLEGEADHLIPMLDRWTVGVQSDLNPITPDAPPPAPLSDDPPLIVSATQRSLVLRRPPPPTPLPSRPLPAPVSLVTQPSSTRPNRRIRLANPADLPQLQPYFMGEHGQDPPMSRPALELLLLREHLYLIESPQLVGLCLLAPAGPYAYLRDLYIFPAFRRQGAARLLVSTVLDHCLNAGLGLYLCVEEQNDAARHLYLSLGFELEGERLQLHFERRRVS